MTQTHKIFLGLFAVLSIVSAVLTYGGVLANVIFVLALITAVVYEMTESVAAVKATVVVAIVIAILHVFGVPQYLMQHPMREVAERAHADIVTQCEAQHCLHL